MHLLFLVLRMGIWARLHREVKEVTLEERLKNLSGRIKQENASSGIKVYQEKLETYKAKKKEALMELNSDETV